MTSYVTDGTVGPWAREKLEYLGKYLNAYTIALQNQTWCEKTLYINAFAGAGKAPLRKYSNENEESLLNVSEFVAEEEQGAEGYVTGSPNVALQIKHPFSDYIFIEKDSKRVSELTDLKVEFGGDRNISVLQGDASQQIHEHLLESGKFNWKKCRGVAFLDPFGMQVPWRTIEAIGKTGAVELILNLPVGMAIQRLLPKSGKFSTDRRLKLDDYFGSPDWHDLVYAEETDLFGPIKTKKQQTGESLARWYQKRLKKAYGYASAPRLIRNTKGSHLYYLMWAGPHPLGAKIASDVLAQGEAI